MLSIKKVSRNLDLALQGGDSLLNLGFKSLKTFSLISPLFINIFQKFFFWEKDMDMPYNKINLVVSFRFVFADFRNETKNRKKKFDLRFKHEKNVKNVRNFLRTQVIRYILRYLKIFFKKTTLKGPKTAMRYTLFVALYFIRTSLYQGSDF